MPVQRPIPALDRRGPRRSSAGAGADRADRRRLVQRPPGDEMRARRSSASTATRARPGAGYNGGDLHEARGERRAGAGGRVDPVPRRLARPRRDPPRRQHHGRPRSPPEPHRRGCAARRTRASACRARGTWGVERGASGTSDRVERMGRSPSCAPLAPRCPPSYVLDRTQCCSHLGSRRSKVVSAAMPWPTAACGRNLRGRRSWAYRHDGIGDRALRARCGNRRHGQMGGHRRGRVADYPEVRARRSATRIRYSRMVSRCWRRGGGDRADGRPVRLARHQSP